MHEGATIKQPQRANWTIGRREYSIEKDPRHTAQRQRNFDSWANHDDTGNLGTERPGQSPNANYEAGQL